MILTLIVFACLSVAGILVFTGIYEERAQELLGDFRESAGRQIRQHVLLVNSPIATFAVDYSRWDDMVNFVRTRDTVWALDNIAPSLGTFGATAAWVYGIDHQRLFAISCDENSRLRDAPNVHSILQQAFKGPLFQRFYIADSSELLDVSFAPIQATADSLRTGPHSGHFVVARSLDHSFIESLASTFHALVEVRSPRDSLSMAAQADSLFEAGTVRVILPLLGWNKMPVSLIVLDIKEPMYAEIINGHNRQMWQLLVIVASLVALLTIALLLWVSLPVRRLSAALHSDSPGQVGHTLGSSPEFEEISQLMQKFFRQNAELQGVYDEQCRMAEALKESEAKFHTVFDNMAEGVALHELIFDETGTPVDYIVTETNAQFAAVSGIGAEQVLNKSARDAYGSGVPPYLSEYAGAVKERKSHYFEAHFEPLKRHFGISVVPSSPHSFATVFSDISARRNAEKALIENNRLMLALMSSVPGMVFRCRNDKKRTLEFVSENCVTLTGYAPADLIENCWVSFADLIQPVDLEMVLAEVAGAVRESRPYQITYRVITVNGDQKWVTERGTTLKRENDACFIVEGIVLDVTEDKRREEQRTRLAAAIEQVADSVFIADAKGFIEYVNPAFETTLGYPLAEVRGKLPRNVLGLVQGHQFYDEVTRKLDRGEGWKGRLVARAKGGKLVEEETTISLVRDSRGKVINIVAVMRDVTEILQLEAQLRQAQKLEAVGSLASGIAHEINTPIQFVGDNTRFLSDAFQEIGTLLERNASAAEIALQRGDCRELLDRLVKEIQGSNIAFLRNEVPIAIAQTLEGIEHVATIVRAMKEFAHPEQGQMSAVDINKILQTTLTVAHNELKHAAELKTVFAENLPNITCFPGSLNQVFLNLLVNAAHAIQEVKDRHGKGLITVSTWQSEGDVSISIADNGVGIRKEIMDRIYDPFFTTKQVGKGTGQGLAIARAIIVEKHGGTIAFESEVGVGTKFVISLPISVEKAVPV